MALSFTKTVLFIAFTLVEVTMLKIQINIVT